MKTHDIKQKASVKVSACFLFFFHLASFLISPSLLIYTSSRPHQNYFEQSFNFLFIGHRFFFFALASSRIKNLDALLWKLSRSPGLCSIFWLGFHRFAHSHLIKNHPLKASIKVSSSVFSSLANSGALLWGRSLKSPPLFTSSTPLLRCDTQLYKRVCPSVGPSVGPSRVFFWGKV